MDMNDLYRNTKWKKVRLVESSLQLNVLHKQASVVASIGIVRGSSSVGVVGRLGVAVTARRRVRVAVDGCD